MPLVSSQYWNMVHGFTPEDVKRDLRNSSSFWSKYEGKVNEVSENMNNTYLKVNGVKEGTISYSKVVNLLLTYYILYEK